MEDLIDPACCEGAADGAEGLGPRAQVGASRLHRCTCWQPLPRILDPRTDLNRSLSRTRSRTPTPKPELAP